MSSFFRSPGNKAAEPELPPAKRISTPAGQRLSVILENGDNPPKKSRETHRVSLRKSVLAGLGEAPRESLEDQSHNSSGYSYSVWSEASGEKLNNLRDHKQITKRGGWKRLALIIAALLIIVVATVVGVVVGLKKGSSNKNKAAASTQSGIAAVASASASHASAVITPGAVPTATPSNFPIGSYSMVTFLDTVQTNCTANPSTWTCYPYIEYNTDANKAMAIFNLIISSPSSGKFQISSTTNPFSISFSNVPLDLLDSGLDTERYRFQITQTKPVSPSSALTSDNSAAECFYNSTNLDAYLYTKMAKSYPDPSQNQQSGNPTFPVWPFAVRLEQIVGGGQDVPNCWKLDNGGGLGQQITEGLAPQDQGQLCSCLYKNWRTPGTY